MKKILSYLLLCIYTSTMIKPVMPSIADALAHIFNYSDHITKVHHHNGKFHVHNEYIEAAKKNSHEDAPYNNILKKANISNEYIIFFYGIEFPMPVLQQDHQNPVVHYLPVIFLPANFHPPISSLV